MILMRQAHPQVLMGTEMMVIAAVVAGGTQRILSGHGSISGTDTGVAAFGTDPEQSDHAWCSRLC